MRKAKTKSFKPENGQTTIFSAINNLKALSQIQKRRKENLPKLIEVHSSDSEQEENSFQKLSLKRRLSFSLPQDGYSETEPNLSKPTAHSTPAKVTKLITINKPDISSTPISHTRQLQDPFPSSLNISNIKFEGQTTEDLDSNSDTIILNNTNSNSSHSNTSTTVSATTCGVSMNDFDDSNLGVVEINGTVLCTIDLTTYEEMNSTEKNAEVNAQHDDFISPRNSKSCPKSPIKISTRSVKKEIKTINSSYLVALRDLFSIFNESSHFANLLHEEKDILNIFCSSTLDEGYQYLCLKLLTLKNKWYNLFKFCEKINLNMDEQDISKLYDWLEENHVVDTDCTKEDLSCLLNRLDIKDIQEIHKKFRLKKANTKEEKIKNLLKYSCSQSTLLSSISIKDLLLREIKQKMGKCIKLKKEFKDSFYNTYLLATFTNGSFANITDYFSNILGLKISLPSYKVQEYNVFHSRNEFLSFAKARKFDDQYENAFLYKNDLEALNISEEIFQELRKLENVSEVESNYIDAPHLKQFSSKAVYIKTICKAVKYLSTKHPLRVKAWLEYLIEKIKSPRIGDWYYHLTWIYMKYLQPPDYEYAAKLLIKALEEEKDYLSDFQIFNLKQRSEQLQGVKKHKIDQLFHDRIIELLPSSIEEFPTITVDALTLRGNEMGRKRSYVINDEDGNKTFMSVENIALDYYISGCGYTDGTHCEGAIVHALFALFFWDIIYDPDPPVPGTFVTKIQQVPLDLNSPCFYSNRKALIDKRLEQITSEWNREIMIEFLKDIYEKHSFEVGITKIDSIISGPEANSLMETLVDCIGRRILSKIFERLIRNIRGYRSGMPDLLIWHRHLKTAKFVEVKGEGDRLRPNQELWLSYLKSVGADIEVCHVHSIGSKRKKR